MYHINVRIQARFRERQTATVARLNHGQTRTHYEHEVYGARDAYATLLIAQSKELRTTPELQAAICKVSILTIQRCKK